MRQGITNDGFTLLEALVALAILSLFLAIAFGGLSQMLLRDREADLTRRTLRIAQNKLDELGIVEPLAIGSRQGVTPEGFSWSQDIRPASSTPLMGGDWVEVHVSAPGDTQRKRTITLTTFRIAAEQR